MEELVNENKKMREFKEKQELEMKTKDKAKIVKPGGSNSIRFHKYETKTYDARLSGKHSGKKVKVKIHTLKPGSIASILKWE